MFRPQLFKQLRPFFLFKQSGGSFFLYFPILITVKLTFIKAVKQLILRYIIMMFF